MPLNIAELQIAGYANVTAIEPCPMIADGEGSVITGRFVTRQVDVIARVEILGADGSIEVLEGTTIHPIWSLDRNEWVPLGELELNERLASQSGPATVLSVTILNRPTAVYNIEVHAEHVYEVGELRLLVHNSTPCTLNVAAQVLESVTPKVRSGLNQTVEATIEAVSKIGSPKGTISMSRDAAETLANQIKSHLGEAGEIIEHFPASGMPHFHIESMHWWHFWY